MCGESERRIGEGKAVWLSCGGWRSFSREVAGFGKLATLIEENDDASEYAGDGGTSPCSSGYESLSRVAYPRPGDPPGVVGVVETDDSGDQEGAMLRVRALGVLAPLVEPPEEIEAVSADGGTIP